MVEDDPYRGPMKIEFTIGQTFTDRRHFPEVLKEFATMKTLELQDIKTESTSMLLSTKLQKISL